MRLVEADSERKLHLSDNRLLVEDILHSFEFQSISKPKKSRSAFQNSQIIRMQPDSIRSPRSTSDSVLSDKEPPIQWIRYNTMDKASIYKV
jgi:hypothetical protein